MNAAEDLIGRPAGRTRRADRPPATRGKQPPYPGRVRSGARRGINLLAAPDLRRAPSADPPFATEECSPYCAGASGAGASGAGVSGGAGGAGVSAAGISDLPSTQLIKVPSYLQSRLCARTTTITAAITIKIRRIRIQAPSLLRWRKVYERAANKKGSGPDFMMSSSALSGARQGPQSALASVSALFPTLLAPINGAWPNRGTIPQAPSTAVCTSRRVSLDQCR
jgi:hypothetical protein